MTVMTTTAGALFEQLGGYRAPPQTQVFEAPVIDATPKKTAAGTTYLTEPGVALFVLPQVSVEALRGFLRGFGEELGFEEYLDDDELEEPGALVSKVAGQLCYLSLGEGRTKNVDIDKYLGNIRSSRHGSVVEHPNYSFIIYGASRAYTHEHVRHRVGWAYSQVSQRFVDGSTLRFVERPEYVGDEYLHDMFVEDIDRAALRYNQIAEYLVKKQAAGDQLLTGEKKRDLRKKVNSCARSRLPNETEAPIIVTANVRSLRHFFEMRAAGPADIEIRAVALRMFLCAKAIEPTHFTDYSIVTLPDGTHAVSTPNMKV